MYPQRLKPDVLFVVYVRAEARTLQEQKLFRSQYVRVTFSRPFGTCQWQITTQDYVLG
jgi:hypothetical protein